MVQFMNVDICAGPCTACSSAIALNIVNNMQIREQGNNNTHINNKIMRKHFQVEGIHNVSN